MQGKKRSTMSRPLGGARTVPVQTSILKFLNSPNQSSISLQNKPPTTTDAVEPASEPKDTRHLSRFLSLPTELQLQILRHVRTWNGPLTHDRAGLAIRGPVPTHLFRMHSHLNALCQVVFYKEQQWLLWGGVISSGSPKRTDRRTAPFFQSDETEPGPHVLLYSPVRQHIRRLSLTLPIMVMRRGSHGGKYWFPEWLPTVFESIPSLPELRELSVDVVEGRADDKYSGGMVEIFGPLRGLPKSCVVCLRLFNFFDVTREFFRDGMADVLGRPVDVAPVTPLQFVAESYGQLGQPLR